MIIYKFTNKINNKVYIGKTIHSLNDRISRHLYDVENGSQFKFHQALRKYGLDGFIIETIFETDNEEILAQNETKFIIEHDSYVNGYNMTLGEKFGPETAKKISRTKKGKPLPWLIGVNDVMKDYRWYNNGFDNIRLHKDKSIPSGYMSGRINKTGKRTKPTNRPKFPNGYKKSQ